MVMEPSVIQRILHVDRRAAIKSSLSAYFLGLFLIFSYFVVSKTTPDLAVEFVLVLVVGVAITSLVALWTIENDVSVGLSLLQVGLLFVSFSSVFTIIQFRLYGQDSYKTASIAAALLDAKALNEYPLPLYHVLARVVGLVFRLNLESGMKYLSLLLFGGLSVLAFQLYRTHFDVRSSLMATLGLTTLPWFVEFNSWAVKQALGLPLVVVGVFLLIRHYRTSDPRYVILYAITLVAAVFTHHLSAALVLFALVSLVVTRAVLRGAGSGRARLHGRLLANGVSERAYGMNSPPFFVLAVLSVVIVSFYWVFFLRTPVDAILLPILTRFSGRVSLSQFVGATVPISYNTVQSHFRLEWLQLKVAFVAGIMVGVALLRTIYDRFVKDVSEIFWGGLVLQLVGAYVISGLVGLSLGFLRIIMVSWIFVLPLFLSALGEYDGRARRILFTAFIALNLFAFPLHAVSPSVNPDYDSSDLGYGYHQTDHQGGQWLQSYGDRGTGELETPGSTTVAVDVKHFGLLNWYWASTNQYRSWVLFTDSTQIDGQYYVFVTPSARHFLKTGHNSSTMTSNPPRLSTDTHYIRIYDSSDVSIYVTN